MSLTLYLSNQQSFVRVRQEVEDTQKIVSTIGRQSLILYTPLMIRSDSDKLSPLEALIEADRLKDGQAVRFTYQKSDGSEVVFNGVVRRTGIEVDGVINTISLAAIRCIESVGDAKSVNGWFAWETEEGITLSELHRTWLGLQDKPLAGQKHTEKFYEYPAHRDVMFVFGAGASYADGAPLQRDILPFILDGEHPAFSKSLVFKIVNDFLADLFTWDEQHYPSLEQVFGLLDYFIQRNESLSRKFSLPHLRLIKESLIQAVYYTIQVQTQHKSAVYSQFWDRVFETNTNITTVTFNYDSLLEDEFLHLYPDGLYLDYCLPLANYDYSLGSEDEDWWVNPRRPIHTIEGRQPSAIKIIKVHGSLNWKYCNCCNDLLLTPHDRAIQLAEGDPPWAGGSAPAAMSMLMNRTCMRDGNAFETMLVPPSHLKDLSHPITTQLFIELAAEIRRAKKVVFVGYSFPEADIHISAVLKKSLQPNTEVTVVDINTSHDFKLRCKALSDSVQFITASFEDLVSDEETMRKILSP